MNFTTIIFDLDGTLLDTITDIANSANYTRAQYNLPPLPVSSYKPMLGNGAKILVQRFLPQNLHAPALFAQAYNTYCTHYHAHTALQTKPFEGIVPLLDALQQKNIALGVVSNKPHEATQQLITQYFGQTFGAVLGKQTGVATKPNPTGLLQCMQALHANPLQTLYVGDSDVDVYTAHNANIPCAGACWGYRTTQELQNAKADYLLHTPLDILPLL